MQQRIQLLSPSVAEKIAAGEVIERPASVVKELVENSLDAGATEIAVILEQGGKGLIEVLDNGAGISRDDLPLAIQRHATSKIRALEDLDRLDTMGFRGEALPSVAAVSELKILARTEGSETAFEIDASRAGDPREALSPVTFGHFLGSQHGTRVQARGLFAQIPARLKFLKSQAAEVSQVREWIERLALTHPRTGFRLVSDDRTVLNLRPQNEEDRVRAILADGEDLPLVSASSDLGLGAPKGVRVRVHWLQGLSAPTMRKLVQVVNRRAVRDRMIQQALLAPFRQALLPGQFPAAVAFLEIDPSLMDVNVHPTKTELRFVNSREVFHAVESLVSSMIAARGAPGFVAGAAQSPTASAPVWNGAPGTGQAGWQFSQAPVFTARESTPTSSGAWPQERTPDLGSPELRAHPFSGGRFAGIVFNTYILLELHDASAHELVLIDQHAAHERIRYEKLRARALQGAETAGRQELLLPEAVKFAAERRGMIEERLGWLEKLGFDAEIFGEDTVLVRTVPSEWGSDELRTRLKALIDRVIEAEARDGLLLDENLFEKLASEACHSAIRAGDILEPEEARALVSQLFECEHPWNCPHGRPTVVRVPEGRFEEWFQRRV